MESPNSNGMFFPHKDGRDIPVKERTMQQIKKSFKRWDRDFHKEKDGWYFRDENGITYKYIGNQSISECNGNIYAEFEALGVKNGNGEPYIATLYIADYYDYIDEIKKATTRELACKVDIPTLEKLGFKPMRGNVNRMRHDVAKNISIGITPDRDDYGRLYVTTGGTMFTKESVLLLFDLFKNDILYEIPTVY